ncbi:hypothetical protein GGX14DRAFT_647558 [Mycena pura]|uniref:Uncharacterized protein n=1 Tax=Mycena pura TaxID=153505 RepID=A0AAD6VDN5_9AGAR|nr:hypothetical protein GGX14DRAFT_647558 [Mycena pura]
MLSGISIAAALVLASAVSANPIARGTCNPTITGSAISIASGGLELGYLTSASGAPILAQTLTTGSPEFFAEESTTLNGSFILKDSNQPSQAFQLPLTDIEGEQIPRLEDRLRPGYSQEWEFICSTCDDPNAVGNGGVIASSCIIVSGGYARFMLTSVWLLRRSTQGASDLWILEIDLCTPHAINTLLLADASIILPGAGVQLEESRSIIGVADVRLVREVRAIRCWQGAPAGDTDALDAREWWPKVPRSITRSDCVSEKPRVQSPAAAPLQALTIR